MTQPYFDPEKRKDTRHEVRCEATLTPVNLHHTVDSKIHVMIMNICNTGVLLQADTKIEEGSTWRLNIINDGIHYFSQPILIRRTRPLDKNAGFLAGASFAIEPAIIHMLGLQTDNFLEHFINDATAFE